MCFVRIILLLLMACTTTKGWWWWGRYDPWNQDDQVGRNTKLVALNITHELVEDAFLKVRVLAEIRDYHVNKIDYQVGYIMGQIREKYRRMMEHYYQWRDKASGKSVFVGPGIRDLYGIHWLMSMEHVALIEHDIAKYINAVLDYFKSDDLPAYDKVGKSTKKKKKEEKRIVQITGMMQEEQALKKRFRAEHLARRLGLPANYTTKSKRFLNKWPVEDTWDNFGPYDIGL